METSHTQRPNRREARRQGRHDAIVAVASRSFLEKGYAGTSMSAVAAEVGGSKATLWNYFPSKEDLFSAVIDRAASDFRARLSALLEPGGDLETSLRSFAASFLEKVTSPQAIALHRLVVGEVLRFPEVGRIFFERAPRKMQALLAAFLENAMDRGLLLRDDPLLAARTLVGLCMTGCHQQLLLRIIEEATPEMIVADADRSVMLFLRAYRVEQG
ncbi:AcrR family transcriptional regulator [Sphingomonas zeicaulis]|uniref:TetR/AcrR family transcriptional regulator n=1 Tax=Sphingomonas zeicaulis TaxID=1632740 RepID=UPI003D1B499F